MVQIASKMRARTFVEGFRHRLRRRIGITIRSRGILGAILSLLITTIISRYIARRMRRSIGNDSEYSRIWAAKLDQF